MGLTTAQLREHLDAVAADDTVVREALQRVGYPEERMRETGYRTLLRTIVGQQVSVAAAASVWRKLEAELGEEMQASELLARDFDTLRACGLSRQKQGYARSLCELVASGELDLDNLPADDEAAIAELTRIKGIGRWSAEIYLLFAEGRQDIWPAGDLAVQAALAHFARPAVSARARRKRAPLANAGNPIAAQWPFSPGTPMTTQRFNASRDADMSTTQGHLHHRRRIGHRPRNRAVFRPTRLVRRPRRCRRGRHARNAVADRAWLYRHAPVRCA